MEKERLSVNADPPAWLVVKTARSLKCSLEEASTVLSPLRPTTPKEEPLLPGLCQNPKHWRPEVAQGSDRPKAAKFVRDLVDDNPNVKLAGGWPHSLPPDKQRGTGPAPAGHFWDRVVPVLVPKESEGT